MMCQCYMSGSLSRTYETQDIILVVKQIYGSMMEIIFSEEHRKKKKLLPNLMCTVKTMLLEFSDILYMKHACNMELVKRKTVVHCKHVS